MRRASRPSSASGTTGGGSSTAGRHGCGRAHDLRHVPLSSQLYPFVRLRPEHLTYAEYIGRQYVRLRETFNSTGSCWETAFADSAAFGTRTATAIGPARFRGGRPFTGPSPRPYTVQAEPSWPTMRWACPPARPRATVRIIARWPTRGWIS